MERTKILFISQEITPYLPENQMSKLSRYLPQGIQEKGSEIRTFMPRYGCINERRNQLHEVIRLSGMNLIINDSDHPLIIKVASIQSARMQVYFIDNEDYFQRKHVMCNDGGYFSDNDERAIFFARGVLETVKKLRWSPDIVHCIGWMTSFVPLYIKKALKDDPLFTNSRVIYSLYDEAFDTQFGKNLKEKVYFDGVTDNDLESIKKTADFYSVSKLAIDYSDGVILGSETINPKLKNYLTTTEKQMLDYHDENTYLDAYSEFYDRILASTCVETV